MPMGNFPIEMPVVKSARLVESAEAGPYLFDVFVPAGAIIQDIIVHAEALWDDTTAASLEIGDYASSAGSDGQPAIGAAIDADGFFTAVDLKATDLLAGESISVQGPQGGVGGAYATAGTNTHVLERLSLVDRFVRAKVAVTDGDGTAGRTYVSVILLQPATKDIDE